VSVLQAGRVAVITGAGSGFGREFARLGARAGMRLVLADIQEGALRDTVQELQQAGAAVAAEVVDVAASRQVARLAERAYGEFGAVNLLINNAGVACGGYLWENSDKDWQWVLGVNLMGVVHGVQHFVPRMLAAEARGEPGHIVNTASMAGWLTAPLMGVYNVSKHAVVALTETLHHDLRLAQSAIGVTLLSPAFVPTGIAQSHRARPGELANPAPLTRSQELAQANSEKAVSGGRVSAAEVAALTFDAVRDNRFYVYTHPKILASVQARFEAALAGEAPADPFASRPAARPTPPA
jgi:NAD(P)-dependent dehydrogenase (short-subunit alcohol dehydrogenase family)